MHLASLFSGGKDSAYALYLAQQEGHEISPLVTMISESDDSYMFHVPNIHITQLHSLALDIPIVTKETEGRKEEELSDLREVLGTLDVDGVVTGAIASSYQKTRIDKLCDELGLKSMAPLWGRDQSELLEEMVKAEFHMIITGVFAGGLDRGWLGRRIDRKCISDLKKLEEQYQINVSGEGGEFESLALDGPNFKKRIEILRSRKIWDRDSGILFVEEATVRSK